MEIELIDKLCVYIDEHGDRQMVTIKSGLIWVKFDNADKWKQIDIKNIVSLGIERGERVGINTGIL